MKLTDLRETASSADCMAYNDIGMKNSNTHVQSKPLINTIDMKVSYFLTNCYLKRNISPKLYSTNLSLYSLSQ